MKNYIGILIFIFMITGCVRQHQRTIRELTIYKTNYTCKEDTCDSTTSVSEYYLFDKDSVITKYVNYEQGYFYLAEFDKKNKILRKEFYTLDTSFMYGSKSQINMYGAETKIEFFDSSGGVNYTILNTYKKQSPVILKQQKIFKDGSVRETVYSYDQWDHLKKKYTLCGKDTIVNERHLRAFDDKDRILTDTVYYPDKKVILDNKYRNGRLYFQKEKVVYLKNNHLNTREKDETYLKKYYLYDPNGNVSEIRNVVIFPGSHSFRINSRLAYIYNDQHQVNREILYNPKNQKVYSKEKKYTYYSEI